MPREKTTGGQPKKKGAKSRARGKPTPRPRGKQKPAPPENGASPPERAKTASPREDRASATSSDVRPAASPAHGTAGLGRYVYCIVRSPTPLEFGEIGLGVEPSHVHTVHYKDLAAVISDTPMGHLLDPTRENVLAHQRVNETVMKDHTVIPMAFGTAFKTKDDIIELLKSAYDAFVDVLTKMENKLEFGLKVLWERDQVVKEIEGEDEDVRRLKTEISSQKGSTYFARMQYGRLIESALQARTERYVAHILAALRDVSVASRTDKPIGDKMILNAAFLVARQKERAFDAKVKELGALFGSLNFRYTGPWPPYNFVNIRLKLERANSSGLDAGKRPK